MSQFHPADRPDSPRLPPTNAEASEREAPRKHLPRYKVVLLRNGVDDLMFVVRCVMELMRYPRAEATHKMWEAYHTGRSVLLITYLERAELYAEQFASKGLKVAVEPA